jgi:hypothetical protein
MKTMRFEENIVHNNKSIYENDDLGFFLKEQTQFLEKKRTCAHIVN